MKFKVNKFLGFAIGTLSLAIAVGVLFVATPRAAAWSACGGAFPQFGRACEHGYFTNAYFNSGIDLWTGGVPSSLGCVTGGTYCGGGTAMDEVNGFIAFVEANKTSGVPREVTSAEFVIDTMEGFAPGTRGAAWNPAVISDWQTKLRKGVQDGTLRIQWNNSWAWGCGQLDTMYNAGPNDIDAYYTFPGGEIPSCGAGVHVPTINFIDNTTGKVVYQIKRTCGNPIGKIGKLPAVPFNVIPGGFLTTNNIVAGSTDTLNVTLDSTGPNESDPGTLQVGRPGNINSPCGSCVGPGQVGLSADQVPGAYGFHGSTAYGGNVHVTTPDWWWNANDIPKGGKPGARFNFTVSAGAPPGVITFWVCFNPATQAGNTVCNPVNLTVVSERQPVVVGQNGDVHAGGGICGGPLNFNGKVEGWPGAGDQTEYVVSATAAISDFGSNQGNGGGQSENLGATGGYQPTSPASVPPYPAVDEVCREDLLGAAEQYIAGGGTGYGTITNAMAANLDVGTLTADPVYYYNGGGVLHLHGTVNSTVTIVAESGTVQIDGNITITGGVHTVYPPDLPSLGIIAANDINISLAATRVDAYMFSNATIDTCLQGVGNTSGCVGASLTVNGFLMASNLLFQREGAFNVDGNPVTETIALNPQIYLDPPKFFDASVDNTSLQGQGEKPPLY
jgi:hypothetical protein